MVKISNIDAIIDLILREARARKGGDFVINIYRVYREITQRVNEVMETHNTEQRRKKKEDKKAEWAKGM